MIDFRLDFAGDLLDGDFALDGTRFAEDGGLETAVVLSLFLDRRIPDDEPIPDGSTDRRGWWGDAFATVDGDQIGSRLWTLARAKLTPQTVQLAHDYSVEALEWFVEDQVVSRVIVEAEAQGRERIALLIALEHASGEVTRFAYVWDLVSEVVARAA